MACPEELTLNLWLADALPPDEAEVVASHIHTCARCAAAVDAARAGDVELHAALELNADELAYLSSLQMALTWRASPAPAAFSWGWIALAVVIAGFVAWLWAGPTVGAALALAIQVGLRTVLLNAALGLVFGVGQALLELIRSPALGLSQPLLALLALALLFWPRQLIPQRSPRS
jgi:hypothetical protein